VLSKDIKSLWLEAREAAAALRREVDGS